ncbi:MAG: hypothetical protein NWS66_14145, partial [Saprospiraceae bacterium]|nr:hypothetical protein [Saprospiraceae bacterium]
MAQTIPSYVPTNGLVGWWPFNGNANDESGNGNHGTVNGATLTSDRFGNAENAYNFNGTSNYISTKYKGILGSNNRTISFWSKTTNIFNPSNCAACSEITAVGWGTNLQGPSASGKSFRCSFNMWATGPTVSCGDTEVTYSSVIPINDNKWHHYIFVVDNNP